MTKHAIKSTLNGLIKILNLRLSSVYRFSFFHINRLNYDSLKKRKKKFIRKQFTQKKKKSMSIISPIFCVCLLFIHKRQRQPANTCNILISRVFNQQNCANKVIINEIKIPYAAPTTASKKINK